MVVNEQHRQVEIAVELDEAARTLAHSTRDIPNPIDSYRLDRGTSAVLGLRQHQRGPTGSERLPLKEVAALGRSFASP